MVVQRPDELARCSGYSYLGLAPHYTARKNFTPSASRHNGLQSSCKECRKEYSQWYNPSANANSKYDPARARARERRQQLEDRAWIEPGWSRAKSLAFWGRHCHICWENINGAIEYDHVVPVSRGGEWSVANVRPAHPACNNWKKAKLLEELDLTKLPECGIMKV